VAQGRIRMFSNTLSTIFLNPESEFPIPNPSFVDIDINNRANHASSDSPS
jgi:hypothetical protein